MKIRHKCKGDQAWEADRKLPNFGLPLQPWKSERTRLTFKTTDDDLTIYSGEILFKNETGHFSKLTPEEFEASWEFTLAPNVRQKISSESQAWLIDRTQARWGLPLKLPRTENYRETSFIVKKSCVELTYDAGRKMSLHDGEYLVWNGYEFMSCQPELFEETYEELTDHT